MICRFHRLSLLALIASGLAFGQDNPPPPTTPPPPETGAAPGAPLPPAKDPGAPPPGTDAPPSVPEAEKKTVVSDEAAVPESFREDRYQATFTKNPFLVRTAPKQVNVASFSEDWELKGIVDRNGVQLALLSNKKTNEFKRVGTEPDKDGFRLTKANPSKSRKEASVEVAKGSETATFTFSDTPSPAAGVTRPGMMPGQVPQGVRPGGTYPAGVKPGMQPTAGAYPGAPAAVRPGAVAPQAVPNAAGGVMPTAGVPGTNTAVPIPGAPPNPVSRRRVLIPSPAPATQQ